MNLAMINKSLDSISNEAKFVFKITTPDEHEQALALIEGLLDDYDNNEVLIDLLSHSIETWEAHADEYTEFFDELSNKETGVSVLATLMDQYQLKTHDFENEIGKKSMVSQVLNGKRSLTLKHIKRLSKRFNIPATLFV